MGEYLAPGVYIEEQSSGPRPIAAVGTSTAAFIGLAPAGPVGEPVCVTNWSQYCEKFGAGEDRQRKDPHMRGAYLSHAVYGYFNNGGGRCYITRILPRERSNGKLELPQLQLMSRASNAVTSMTLKARNPITENITVEVLAGPPEQESTFTLRLKHNGTEESYENVTLGRGRSGSAGRNVVDEVNQKSALVTIVEEQATGSIAERAPELGTRSITPIPHVVQDLALATNDFIGDVSQRTGVAGLQIAEDATMVCCPDIVGGKLDRDAIKAVQQAMIDHCALMGDRVAILDTPRDLSPQEALTWRKVTTNFDSKFASMYYPWITVNGPDGNPLPVPPSGHIAGIYARNDRERGVHKAPANEVIQGALSVLAPVTKGEQDILNPEGVNCIRPFAGRGVRVWGARTLSSDAEWRYINVRRLFNFVERSIEQGTQWVVFEPNDPQLWARVRRDVGAFLTSLWRAGMLFGTNPTEAFFVKCDEELNPPEERNQGRLFIDVGLAPVKPAEFVIFRLSQYAGGGA